MREAAMYFAEIGSIPNRFIDLPPVGKPNAVLRRYWSRHWRNWTDFITSVKKHEPELCSLAVSKPVPEIKEEVKPDPLDILRASTKEK